MKGHKNLIQSSYHERDVTFLLQDVSHLVEELTVPQKESRIQAGESYAQFLSKEARPTQMQNELFHEFMEQKAQRFAEELACLAQKIYQFKGETFVLVSLARAGTPIGILLRRYFAHAYDLDIPHYSISILRGGGIDASALADLVGQYGSEQLQFVDGWTGKGSIIDELEQAIQEFNQKNQQVVSATLAVVADPAKRCQLYGTREDVMIPNCFFNGTISGLVSRTLDNQEIQQAGRYHGARYLDYLQIDDQSLAFIETMSAYLTKTSQTACTQVSEAIDETYAEAVTSQIQTEYAVTNRHKIKLSVGESARVLLRR
ncbi:MAG: cysteine protease StiP domain-containing protein, partial [Culicoidibacterales bacterium]